MRSLDGIAHVLAIAVGDLAEHAAVGSEDLAAVPLVGPRLLPADEQLVGAIDRREGLVTPGHRPGVSRV
jgi:hypothetical protein